MLTSRPRSIQKKKSIKDFFNSQGRKKYAIFAVLVLAIIGAYFLFISHAASNNCQAENQVQICDVDQTIAGNDTVLSLYGEAESLGNQGWGTYFGAAFRAPTSAYDGAVPVTRVFNASASWHEFVTDAQRGQKEAKAGGADKLANEGVSFFAWTDGHHPGTVPVYRITRMGAETQSVYSTDKAWIDQQINGPWGWKMDDLMPGIAFYAFPPSYTVAGIANPYDCSIFENFVSARCTQAAANLQKNIDAGNLPATCPNTWADWNKAVNPGSLPQDCQDKWNKYATNCSNTDVFMSDRCKAERDALAAANKAQADAKKKADADAAAAAAKKKKTAPGTATVDQPAPTDNKPAPANHDCGTNSAGQKGRYDPRADICKYPVVPAPAAPAPGSVAAQCAGLTGPAYIGCVKNTTPIVQKGTCLVKWKMDKVWGVGSGTDSRSYKDVTASQCQRYLSSLAGQTEWNDFFVRRRHDFNAYWPNSSTQIGHKTGVMK